LDFFLYDLLADVGLFGVIRPQASYLRQWNEVNIGGDYEIGRFVGRCVYVSVCVHELAEIMHSYERHLVTCSIAIT